MNKRQAKKVNKKFTVYPFIIDELGLYLNARMKGYSKAESIDFVFDTTKGYKHFYYHYMDKNRFLNKSDNLNEKNTRFWGMDEFPVFNPILKQESESSIIFANVGGGMSFETIKRENDNRRFNSK